MIGPKTKLTLQRKTSDDDGMGGRTEGVLTEIKSIKGVLSTIRGDERLSADKKTVIADYYFYMDYPKGFTITEIDEFYLSTRKFKIIHINNLGANQNRKLKITLKEEV